MQDINNAVIVDVFSAFADFVATGRTKADLLGDRLVAFWAESHNFILKYGSVDGLKARNRKPDKNELPVKSLLSFIRMRQAPDG
ncbi:MAG: hypothetical protein P8X68_13730 [Desulfobacterales bacterium]